MSSGFEMPAEPPRSAQARNEAERTDAVGAELGQLRTALGDLLGRVHRLPLVYRDMVLGPAPRPR